MLRSRPPLRLLRPDDPCDEAMLQEELRRLIDGEPDSGVVELPFPAEDEALLALIESPPEPFTQVRHH